MKNLGLTIDAIQYIEDHFLKEKIELEDVADALHYSKYHLHRIFSMTVGLTIHEYAIRRKLTEAAKFLVFSKKSIMEIAIIAGYESQQSFTNAFKAMYKYSPHKFRKNEVFYPLQLKYDFKDNIDSISSLKNNSKRKIKFANESDVSTWMDLLYLSVDGFPYLDEKEHKNTLKQYIKKKSAILMFEGDVAIGSMMINYESGSIDFLAVHPLYKKKGVSKDFLNVAMTELLEDREISITTFREGDKADTGYRNELKKLGFVEGELLTEFGYPTQKMIFKEEKEEDFPDEAQHLKEIMEKINFLEKQAKNSVEKTDKSYNDTKSYMAKYRGEIDPTEMFQNELALNQIDRQGFFEVKIWEKLKKIKESPYFARIDFKGDGELEEVFYIGRFALADDGDLLISDWRSPIAGIFYDYEIGKCGYDAPFGRIEGELIKKRQFKIKNGKIDYVFETSMNIQDNVLQKELSSTSDSKMKSIISTIQREQNRIIRNEKSEIMIIQGVAGSGKTSVALHRVAFMLYKFKDNLKSNNVVILSPNKVFGDYISTVLPELGEEPILQTSLRNIADTELEGLINFQYDEDILQVKDENLRKRIKYKSTIEFLKLIEEYFFKANEHIFNIPENVKIGDFVLEGKWINERFLAYEKHPIIHRAKMVSDDIYEFIETKNIMGNEIPNAKGIFKKIKTFIDVKSPLELYIKFYKDMGISDMFFSKTNKILEWNDVYPFMYFKMFFYGTEEYNSIKHLVIDEMQDYTPIEYAVLNKIFKCRKTILGDFGQFVNPNKLNNLNDLKSLYKNADFVEMNKSYRSTYEIIQFAKKIRNVNSIEPIERHGDEPEIISCKNHEEEIRKVKRLIDEFKKSDRATLGIILKTDELARKLYSEIVSYTEINLIIESSDSFLEGVSIMSVKMAKGLEFDEVIIPMASEKNYFADYDSGFLYVACTRAMHKLTLTYEGKLTGLINNLN